MTKEVIVSNRSLTIGMDVDAHSAVVVVRDDLTGNKVGKGKILTEESSIRDFVSQFPGCSIRAYYEAGCTGFGLARLLLSLGVDCKVVPPSDLPKEPNASRMKTDATDAWRLSHVSWIPPRSFARIPTVEEESDRQLIRTREQFRKELSKTKDRIRKFHLYHGLSCFDGDYKAWTRLHLEYLREQNCGSSALRLCLDNLIDHLEGLNVRMSHLDRALLKLSRTARYSERCKRLKQIPGVGILTAMCFLLEVFRPEEFSTARAIACHVGFTPSEWSTGGTSRKGHITRWGSPHLRRILVEAAWRWKRRDPDALRCFSRIRSGKAPKTAIVGMARRLAIAMWAMTVKEVDYRYHWAA